MTLVDPQGGRHLVVDELEEPDELGGPMARSELGDHLPGSKIKGG